LLPQTWRFSHSWDDVVSEPHKMTTHLLRKSSTDLSFACRPDEVDSELRKMMTHPHELAKAKIIDAVVCSLPQTWRFSHSPDEVDSELRKMMTHPLMGGEGGEADASHGPKNLVVVSRCDSGQV